MEEKKKSNAGLVVIVIILLLACIGMGTFIFINKDKLITTENNQTAKKQETKEKTEETDEEKNTIETRECVGVYSGTAAILQDAQTGQNTQGTLTIELKSDGTYELKKDNNSTGMGDYTIVEDALLLKTAPSVTGPSMDTSAKYSDYLNISSDCSTISSGYGSYFFDPNFTLTKQS